MVKTSTRVKNFALMIAGFFQEAMKILVIYGVIFSAWLAGYAILAWLMSLNNFIGILAFMVTPTWFGLIILALNLSGSYSPQLAARKKSNPLRYPTACCEPVHSSMGKDDRDKFS